MADKEIINPKLDNFREAYNPKYKKASEYQKVIVPILKRIFNKDLVKNEWNSVRDDIQLNDRRDLVYAPRIDVAVGPFNYYLDNDIGIDNTKVMKDHPFMKKILERNNMIKWNDVSRCLLAIEVVFSGSTKHICGDFLNASFNGSYGILVVKKKEYKKVLRISNYFTRTHGVNTNLQNLMIFDDESFLEFLWEIENSHKLSYFNSGRYLPIVFTRYLIFKKKFNILIYKERDNRPLSEWEVSRLKNYGFLIREMISRHDITLSPTRYTGATSFWVYEVVDHNNKSIKIIDIHDISVNEKYRRKGIGSQILKYIEKTTHENEVTYICGELGDYNDSVELQKIFFHKNGFNIENIDKISVCKKTLSNNN